MMAEFDDIEYEGIGADRSVGSVGSERCFRDRSPCDTIITLSDDGKGLYTHPIPIFHEPPEQCQHHQETDQPIPIAFGSEQNTILKYDDITAKAIESRPSSSGSSSTPLGRYKRDVQTHEQLVLGQTPHQRHTIPQKRAAEVEEEPSSPRCPKRGQSSILESLRTQDPQTRRASAAAELAELIKVRDSPAWDEMSVNEQVKLTINMYMKAQEIRRSNRAPRVRTKSRLPVKKD
ncbi:hypothetical protein F4810DRAFT_69679 [Camillea tinctor]|nr:hypothetical protein F4810DRAFT_69679 [Camillea tinctor]